MTPSFERQKVLQTGDPILNIPEFPSLVEAIKANGLNMRMAMAFDSQTKQWRQQLQQEVSKKLEALNEPSVQGGGVG